MRYRLRTLLIVITVASTYLAWATYCRRMAAFHRQQSSLLISAVAKREGWTHQWVEDAVTETLELWPQKVHGEGHLEPVYSSAVFNETTARKYDRAVWHPWTLISK